MSEMSPELLPSPNPNVFEVIQKKFTDLIEACFESPTRLPIRATPDAEEIDLMQEDGSWLCISRSLLDKEEEGFQKVNSVTIEIYWYERYPITEDTRKFGKQSGYVCSENGQVLESNVWISGEEHYGVRELLPIEKAVLCERIEKAIPMSPKD
jgi:hypothetical protein